VFLEPCTGDIDGSSGGCADHQRSDQRVEAIVPLPVENPVPSGETAEAVDVDLERHTGEYVERLNDDVPC
jgi:hypothetical protein